MITQEELKQVLRYDLTTGIFTWINARGRQKAGAVAGSTRRDGYISIKVKDEFYLAHRLAWIYITGSLPRCQIDHRNSVKKDNAWANIREASPSENKQNLRNAQSKNTTGLLGVSRSGPRYIARIQVGERQLYLGTFSSAADAHAKYVSAKRQYHPFGCL